MVNHIEDNAELALVVTGVNKGHTANLDVTLERLSPEVEIAEGENKGGEKKSGISNRSGKRPTGTKKKRGNTVNSESDPVRTQRIKKNKK